MKGRFMDRDETITILRTYTTATPHIPTGVKEDKFFYNKERDIIRNTPNNEKSDCAELIHGLQRPSVSNMHFYPFQY